LDMDSPFLAEVNVSRVAIIVGAFMAGMAALFGTAVLAEQLLHFDFDAAWQIVCGVFLLGLAITRPRWFWNDRRVVGLRSLIGDRASLAIYLLVPLAIAGVGARRQWDITSARQRCTAALAVAADSHARSNILYNWRAEGLPSLVPSAPSSLTCEQLRH